MDSNYQVRQITSLYKSCNRCGLPIVNCICSKIQNINTEAKVWILSTKKEFIRSSNTARLLKMINPSSTEIYLWERTKLPEEFVKKLNDEIFEPYLLFPTEDEDAMSRRIEYKKTHKNPAFIILDGTWKEARKIYRKSDYLKNLPIISLDPDFQSKYNLRKGAPSGCLCTIETAIEVLRLNGEFINAQTVSKAYKLFLKSFKASVCGHDLKEEGNAYVFNNSRN